MPTYYEFKELIDNCTWTWTSRGRKTGYQVTSNINGNSIFLPAAGVYKNTSVTLSGIDGYYWSSTLNPPYPYTAYNLYLNSEEVKMNDNGRPYGRSVRPVKSPY